LEHVSLCEKQALPGECYISSHAWLLAREKHPGYLVGSQNSKSGSTNWKLEAIKTSLELPPSVDYIPTKELAPKLKQYVQSAVIRHVDGGTKRYLAELRTVSVIFVNLTTPFKPNRKQELQDTVFNMQSIVYEMEGEVRQFMIDDKGSVFYCLFWIASKCT